ncbi:MAG TPA: TonB-dependent receptor [Bacteroidales bacterium]|nr:TonB-dependent receptor [Bacteroidales bacterium]
MKRSLLVIFMFLTLGLFGQSPLKTPIDGLFFGNLNDVLSRINQKYGVKFDINNDLGNSLSIKERPMNLELSVFLDNICKTYKLKYFVDKNNVIHIIERWENPDLKNLDDKKKYNGKPTRYNLTLTGKIIDKATRETLPFVNLTVKGTAIGTASNVDGHFTILNVPNDTVSLECSYIGYDKQILYLSPQSSTSNLIIELITSSQELEEIVITGEKQDILEANEKTSMIKLTPLKLNTLPNLGEKDILRSFQLMPGISAANENSSGLYVRGGTPDQSLVLYDGFTVYNVEHLFGFFSSFNSSAIKDVQLYKGGFDAKFGGRISSVVEITGKEGDRKRFNASVDIGMLSFNGFTESPIGEKSSIIVSYRRSWESPVYNKIFNQFSSQSTSSTPDGMPKREEDNTIKSYFYDFNTKFTKRISEKENLTLSFYNGADNLDNSFSPHMRGGGFGGGGGMGPRSMNINSTDFTYWGNTGSSIKWSKSWTNKFYNNALFSFSNYFSKRERSTGGSFTDSEGNTKSISQGVFENNNLLDFTIKNDFEYKLTSKQKLEFGTQSVINDIKYSYAQNDTLKIIDRKTKGLTFSTYLQDKLTLLDEKLNFTAGLRYNYFTGTKKSYIEPRFNTSYQINQKIKLKASVGKYYQFAKRVVREDIMQGSRDFWALADGEKLPVSSANHYILGFSYETKDYLIDIEGYYKTLSNLSEYSLRFQTSPGNVSYEENYQIGKGTAQGIDFLFQKKYGNYTGWVGYTIGRVINKYNNYGNYYYYASNDVTHELKLVNSYKWRNWDFSITWIYATGKPYTAPEGGYQITLLDGTTSDYINVTVKNGVRLPNYHRLDASATYNFKIAKTSPCSLSFSVFNLYNRKNVWYNEYQIIENQIIKTPVNFLGITPNISLNIKFR